jgi:Flp pilus assembly protein TadB
MGTRYRKGIKIAPGLKLNLNAHSVSLTGGVPGAHLTLNSKGYRTTSVGAPGTGLSYRTTKRAGSHTDDLAVPTQKPQPAATTNTHMLKAIMALIFLSVIGCVVLQVLTGHWWLFFVGLASALVVLWVVRSIRN